MKRKAENESDTEPVTKKQKVSSSNQSKPKQLSLAFTSSEIKQLLQLFNHLESQKIQNQTLDRCIYDSYKSMSNLMNTVKILAHIHHISMSFIHPCTNSVDQNIKNRMKMNKIRSQHYKFQMK